MAGVGDSLMDESTWDDPPSLLDDSELSSSLLDNCHASQIDEDDGEMELSSSLPLSTSAPASSSVNDSDDDRTSLFSKGNQRLSAAADVPHLSHLTERQQLAYLMRTTQQSRRSAPSTPSSSSGKQHHKRHASPAPPPIPPLHTKLKPQPPTTAAKQPSKPSMLTHDKKRRRTTTITSIDPDDSHLYTVQRLPPAATAPAPLPVPVEYGKWSVEQRRRWDRVSEQPGLYYYHHSAPGVAVRVDEWDVDEIELMLHLLVCHPLAGGGGSMERVGKGEWGLFSMNVPGRVGLECERKWKQLAAAGRLLSEDRFDYMQWYERQRQRLRTTDTAQPTADTAVVRAVEGTAAKAEVAQPTSSPSIPAVIGRKRVGAPAPQPTAVKAESDSAISTAPQPPAPEAGATIVKLETAAAVQLKQEVHREVKAEPSGVTEKRESGSVRELLQRREKQKEKVSLREQPPRKKTVHFSQPPATALPAAKPAPTAAAITEPASQAAVTSPAIDGLVAQSATAGTSRRPPPARIAIPALPPSNASERPQSALWPPRPPRMPIAASPAPSTIAPQTTQISTVKRLDITHLTVNSAVTHSVTDRCGLPPHIAVSASQLNDADLTSVPHCSLLLYGFVFIFQPLELHLLRAQAAYDVRKARLQSLLHAELARLQPNSTACTDQSSIGHFRVNAARLSEQYFCQPSQAVEQSACAVEQHKLVKALHVRIAMMQADVEREYRLQCDMLNAVHAACP